MTNINANYIENDLNNNLLDIKKVGSLLYSLMESENTNELKNGISILKENAENSTVDAEGFYYTTANPNNIQISHEHFLSDLKQIVESQTLGRAKYYIERIIKSLQQIKTGKINDLNLNRWKQYDDILTDSLWYLDKRDNSGSHHGGYWGNFIPQIPNQFLRRYTKKGDTVLDTFLGSGTTLIECRRLGRNGVGIELQQKVADMAKSSIEAQENKYNIKTDVIVGDSTSLDFKTELKKVGVDSVQFLIMHPPYWDIIQFSENKNDLSNAKTIDDFLAMLGKIVDGTYDLLDNGRYFALVIGDKYSGGEWIPLAFYCMQEVMKRGYILKSTIVKNFKETKGKRNQQELWRYRALVGGFYIFKHEYIFLFQKKGRGK